MRTLRGTRLMLSLQLPLLFLCFSVTYGVILDFDQWLDNPNGYLATQEVGFNLSRDAKRGSSYGRPPSSGYGYGRPPYSYGHHYRPQYKPSTTTTTTPAPPPLECGSGSYHGGPPLECMLRTECIAQGGVLGDPCGRGFSRGFCCEFPHRIGCGETTDEVHVLFRNPDYPDTTSIPFSCIAGIVPRAEACGIRIEFLDAVMSQSRDGFCYQDSFTILGGGSIEADGFNTPFCGIIKGYATVIPVNQTSDLIQLVVNSQSRNVMWNVNITQVHCASLYLPFDDLCGVKSARSGRTDDVTVAPHHSSKHDMSWAQDTSLFPLAPGPGLSASKIIGGQAVGGTQFPWMASVRYDNVHTCGATVIARQWVMTAAHCVTQYAADTLIPIKRFRVWLGSYDISKKFPGTDTEKFRIVRKLERIYVHNEYEGSNYDVAILKLNETVIFNVAIRPVCFPEDPDESFRGYSGMIAGWGSIGGPTANSPTLQGAFAPIVTNVACSTAWSALNVFIRDSMMCAGNGGTATCTGDSGGPLVVVDDDGLYVMVGVASFGAPPQCGNPTFPDVYSRVSAYISWVALVLAIPLPDF